jgi:hypothetical protein
MSVQTAPLKSLCTFAVSVPDPEHVRATTAGSPAIWSSQPGHEPFVIISIVSLELCDPAAGVIVTEAEPVAPIMMSPRFTLPPFCTTIACCSVVDSEGPRHAAIAATATTTPAAITRLLRTTSGSLRTAQHVNASYRA